MWGGVALYTGNPYLAGAAGGFADGLFTNALKAIPGGEDTSWETALLEIGVGTAAGALSGVFGGSTGMTASAGARQLLNKQGSNAVAGFFSNTAMRTAFSRELGKQIGRGLLSKAALGGAKGVYGRFGDQFRSALFGGDPFGGGGDPTSGRFQRGTRPPGSVWNQFASPRGDAWGSAPRQSCIEYAWR